MFRRLSMHSTSVRDLGKGPQGGLPGIVVLTGAGISRESGLDTFRDAGGIWQKYSIEDVCTPEGFARDPVKVQTFYNEMRAQLSDVAPNAAHVALAELEHAWVAHGGDFVLVTQNIDDLHERAGSERLLHMHGELLSARCLVCEARSRWSGPITPQSRCPVCGVEGRLRPDIVWFGEIPLYMDEITEALRRRCGLFIAIGTSGKVWPAAGFISEVRGRARTVELNLERSDGASLFDEEHNGAATQVVPAFVADLLAGLG